MTGPEIRARRTAAGLSQSALAARLGVARERISEWESGRIVPSAAALRGIAAALTERPVYVVGSEAGDAAGWTPETLAAALLAPLSALGVDVVCRPRESGVGSGLHGTTSDGLREAVQLAVETVVTA